MFGIIRGGGAKAPAAPAGAAPASAASDAAACAITPSGAPIGPDGKPKRICCSCPDTKKLRDTCVAERGEEHPYCQALIEAHKACLRVEGFNV